MHVITVTGHDPGDYLHPDQKVEIIDEATGKKYTLYLRSNAMAPTEHGEGSLFVPVTAIKALQADQAYCVLTLSSSITAHEAEERKKLLTVLSGNSASRRAPSTAAPQKRDQRRRVVPPK